MGWILLLCLGMWLSISFMHLLIAGDCKKQAILSGVISAAVIIIAICLNPFSNIEYVTTDKEDLYALEDNVSSNGRVFLGSGTVEGESKYFYMISDELGYKTNSSSSSNSFIKEIADNQNAYVELKKKQFKNNVVGFLFPLNWLEQGNATVFHIPKGSISNDYNVDLKN